LKKRAAACKLPGIKLTRRKPWTRQRPVQVILPQDGGST
jgi:hypothetical protein